MSQGGPTNCLTTKGKLPRDVSVYGIVHPVCQLTCGKGSSQFTNQEFSQALQLLNLGRKRGHILVHYETPFEFLKITTGHVFFDSSIQAKKKPVQGFSVTPSEPDQVIHTKDDALFIVQAAVSAFDPIGETIAWTTIPITLHRDGSLT